MNLCWRWYILALRSSVTLYVVSADYRSELTDNIVVLRPPTLVARGLNLEVVRRDISRAFNMSTQLGVLKAIYYFYYMHHRGAKPKELMGFIKNLGIEIRSNVVRAKLSYLHRKGLVVKRGHRYIPREDFDINDLEKLIDIARAKAGRIRWIANHAKKNWRPKHSVSSSELLRKHDVHNIKEHIKALIAEGKDLKALATLIYFGGGLRPSDRIVELGFKEGSFYAIIYEPKLKRYRLVYEEYDRLWRELLKDEEMRQWLLEMIKRHDEVRLQWPWKQEYRWRISENEWCIMASSIKKKEKRIARRVYLCYQIPNGQAYTLLVKNGKPLVIGVHSDPLNDGYYIER